MVEHAVDNELSPPKWFINRGPALNEDIFDIIEFEAHNKWGKNDECYQKYIRGNMCMTGYGDISVRFSLGYIRTLFIEEREDPGEVFKFIKENYEEAAKIILYSCTKDETEKDVQERSANVNDLVRRYKLPVKDLLFFDFTKFRRSGHVEEEARRIMGIVD